MFASSTFAFAYASVPICKCFVCMVLCQTCKCVYDMPVCVVFVYDSIPTCKCVHCLYMILLYLCECIYHVDVSMYKCIMCANTVRMCLPYNVNMCAQYV